jgi:hypothetical protein
MLFRPMKTAKLHYSKESLDKGLNSNPVFYPYYFKQLPYPTEAALIYDI